MPEPDFFARQDIARRHTKLLEVYLFLAVAGTILLSYFAIAALLSFRNHPLWDPQLFLIVTVGTVFVVGCGSLFKMAQLAKGGSAVAEMLGGQLVNSNTTDPDERRLLDVVEEMAIASGTPVPPVYVLHGEKTINAFAAGHSTKDMVVCATAGAMRLLKRDELQGVMGHEFSHILNGDMKLNLRLMGLVFGLLCIAIFGRLLLSSGDRRNMALPVFGLALLAVGGLGVFFAKLIKSAVSRQREFLADASSVQFTRNPLGLASALKKVGGGGSRLDAHNAEDASHLFFANGLKDSWFNMFSTHPPLDQRIRLLDPGWDGKFIEVDIWAVESAEDTRKLMALRDAESAPPTPPVRKPFLSDLLGGRAASAGGINPVGAIVAGALLQPGSVSSRHLDYAADWRSKLPAILEQAARDPMSAVALIYALLLTSPNATDCGGVIQQNATDPGIFTEMLNLYPAAKNLDSRARLPLVGLAMTALRGLSPKQFEQFSQNIQYIIAHDREAGLFEYALQKIVLRQLESKFKPPKRAVIQYYALKAVIPYGAVLLSALAYAGDNDPQKIEAAFRAGANKLGSPDLKLLSPADCALPKVDIALDRLNESAPQIKKTILQACAETVAADGVIKEDEAELLRAIADTLDCPLPPFVSV